MKKKDNNWPVWERDDKSVVSCSEKIKVMKENFDELKQLTQDAFEDGLLMEVSEKQLKNTLQKLIEELDSPIKKNKV
tara:strand:- start:81 stop:311 length:231 start_codon:yes stop_codon:yes gene_type:complete